MELRLKTADEQLTSATCELRIDGRLAGTAWLFSEDGYLFTAGHLLGHERPRDKVEICFIDDKTRSARVIYWLVQKWAAIDCAILRLEDAVGLPLHIRPLRVSLQQYPTGTFRLRGYGTTLKQSSSGTGRFLAHYYAQNSPFNCLFRLDSKELGESGYSGGAVYCDHEGAAVGIQVEASEHKLGPGRDTVLAMPLYRVAALWPNLYTIIGMDAEDSHLRTLNHEQDESLRLSGACELHGLPARASFIERRHMSGLLAAMKTADPVIALVGPSGSGKSASAREAAYRLAELPHAPTHIVLVGLGHETRTPLGAIINRLASALGFREIASLREDRKVERCLHLLRKRRLLLIIDNLDTYSVAAVSDLMGFLRELPQGCSVLLTTVVDSEDALQGFRRIRVPYLDPTETLQFAGYFAERYDPAVVIPKEQTFLKRLVFCTGGSPKAISLMIGAMRYLPPTTVLEEFESLTGSDLPVDQPMNTNSPVVENLARHHRPLWSVLSLPARRLLATATLFRGSASYEGLKAAAALTAAEFMIAAKDLVSAELLEYASQRGHSRYQLHQSTFFFARSHMMNDREFDYRSTVLRVARHFIDFLRKYPEGASIVEPDTSTIITISRWCSDSGEKEVLLNIALAAYDILFSLGLFVERIELAHLATEAAIESEKWSVAAHFVSVSASTETLLGHYEKASQELQRGLELAIRSQDIIRVAYIQRCIALNLYRKGDVTDAERVIHGLSERVTDALLSENTPDRRLEGEHTLIDILALKGSIELATDQIDTASTTFAAMLAACIAAGWQRAVSYPLRDQAEIDMIEGRKREAEVKLGNAMRIASDFCDYRQIAKIHLSYTKLRLHQGRFRSARRHFKEARHLFATMGLDNELHELNALYGGGYETATLRSRLCRALRPIQRLKAYYGKNPIGGE